VKSAILLTDALESLLPLYAQLGQVMTNVLRATFKPDVKTLQPLRDRIAKAKEAIAKAGPTGIVLIRYCDGLSRQVDNLQRLAEPSKKDFGAFSGLVAAALFLPLFLAISWGNSLFNVGLGAVPIATTCLTVALIGGFGLGALKFRSLIFPSSATAR
jgi:hypothetical protein